MKTGQENINPDWLEDALRYPLVPAPDNFTTPSRTPWGGRRIAELKTGLLKNVPGNIVGESWEISDHPSFPNRIIYEAGGSAAEIPIAAIGRASPCKLYGNKSIRRFGPCIPFLVKLLNSGSWLEYKNRLEKTLKENDGNPGILSKNNHELHNYITFLKNQLHGKANPCLSHLDKLHRGMLEKNLSVQVHPSITSGKNAVSKAEAWYIIEAEQGAGIYLGLQNGVTEKNIENALSSNQDITRFLNFVEVRAGDVYYIPPGTPHSIGAGILLYEVQEPSEITYRLYDFDRRDSDGNPRELHVEKGLKAIDWNMPRGENFIKAVKRLPKQAQNLPGKGAKFDLLADEPEFVLSRLSFESKNAHYEYRCEEIQGLTVTYGSILIRPKTGKEVGPFKAGQSIIIPAAVEGYELTSCEAGSIVLHVTAAK